MMPNAFKPGTFFTSGLWKNKPVNEIARARQKAMDGTSRNLSAMMPGAGFIRLVNKKIEVR